MVQPIQCRRLRGISDETRISRIGSNFFLQTRQNLTCLAHVLKFNGKKRGWVWGGVYPGRRSFLACPGLVRFCPLGAPEGRLSLESKAAAETAAETAALRRASWGAMLGQL